MFKIPFFKTNQISSSSSTERKNNNASQAKSNFDAPKAEGSTKQIKHRQGARQSALLSQWASAQNAGSVAKSSRPESNQNTEAKAQLIDGLQKIKQHFSTLLKENWSPQQMEDAYDLAILPVLVASENKRSPNLKLSLLPSEQDLGKWLGDWQKNAKKQTSARVMFTMPGFSAHKVVADIKRDKKGNVSVLVVEPLGLKGKDKRTYENVALPELQKKLNDKALKGKVTLTVLALDTQKSTNDCRIFGLSAASKMADEAGLFNVLHEQNLAGEFKTAKGGAPKNLAVKDQIKIIDGKGLLPLSFFKHSQSKTVLNEWLAQNPPAFANASVNKSGQSLIQRFENHQTTRYKSPVNTAYFRMMNPQHEIKKLRIGTSIEEKRLTYIDRALDYLDKASEDEVNALRQDFNHTVKVWRLLEPGDLRLGKRELGPHPDTPSVQDALVAR